MDSEEYRNSHKSKGVDYDETILSTPLDAYMDKWEGHHLMRVLTGLFSTGIPRYLDFACGTGRITQRIEPLATESYGVDVSESMLSLARGKCPRTKFLCTDLTRGDAELGSFDLVTSFRFFGNAQDELRASALASINRHLRPGGSLIINNHRNPRSLLGVTHRLTGGVQEMDLTHAKLKALLRRHGFEITYQRAIGFWIFRSKLATLAVLQSAGTGRLERAFQHSWLAPFSLDALLVARKIA